MHNWQAPESFNFLRHRGSREPAVTGILYG